MLEITIWKMIRELLGFTMEDVGEMMHCTKQTISNIENGRGASGMALHLYVTTMQLLVNRNRDKTGKLMNNLEMIIDFLKEA